jgi:hypothetical protein
MAMANKNTILFISAAVLAVAFWYWYSHQKDKKKRRESYMSVGNLGNLGSVDSRPYEVLSEDGPADTWEPTPSASEFASYIDDGTGAIGAEPPPPKSSGQRYSELLESARLPLTAAQLPQFNVDVANPSTYSFHSQLRIPLKNRRRDEYGGAYEKVRGSVPIAYWPGVALIDHSAYASADSQVHNGFFTAGGDATYRKYTNTNMPQQVMTQETIMDY